MPRDEGPRPHFSLWSSLLMVQKVYISCNFSPSAVSGELWVLTRAVHTTSLVILTPVPSTGTAQTLQTPTLRLRGKGTCPGSRASKGSSSWNPKLSSSYCCSFVRFCVLGAQDHSVTLQVSRELWAKARVFLPHLVTQGSPSPCTPSIWIYNWLKEQPARPTAAPSPCPGRPWVGSQAFLLLGPRGAGGTW